MIRRFLWALVALAVLALPAASGEQVARLSVNNLTGFGAIKSSGTVSVTHQGSAVDASNLTTYSFASQPLGSGIRKIVVIFTQTGSAENAASSVTIDGQSASLAEAKSGGTSDDIEAWYYDDTTGSDVSSTGTVEITWGGAKSNTGIDIYTLTGAASGAPDSGDSASTSDESTPTSINDTVNCPANGAIIGGVYSRSGTDRTFTWTNLANEPASSDTAIEAGLGTKSSAYEEFTAAQTARSITATASGSTSRMGMALVCWGPS